MDILDKYYVEIESQKDGEIITCFGNEHQAKILGKNINETYETGSLHETMIIINNYVAKMVTQGHRITHKELL